MLRTLVEHATLFLVWFLLIGFLMFTVLSMGFSFIRRDLIVIAVSAISIER